MASENKSFSYLEERDNVRRWLLNSKDGRLATEVLRRGNKSLPNCPGDDLAPVLDDDKFTSFQDIVDEYRDGTLLATTCEEARGVFDLAKGSKSNMALPGVTSARWSNFFSAPIGYVLRRQIQTGDPDYWNKPQNIYREALANPNWCKVPISVIRGKLEASLPKAKLVTIEEK